ncbi:MULTISPECIES: 2-dehydro-3-deoxygalactonokinase [Sphingomonas]|uniref:2-dehydro-3-deoxygalactonokinase n=1 Tax=Sphingomonas zeae TaxID=1646122 RepID=A0A7Y6B8C5_9SPHN|nr:MULTISPECIES: 2-dehydro-3-deoxygalactonokinase [Sphingomonas]MBB4047454.1 2-dehydro-3-deoxygalactonokinase [Sphingomonas zeae]MDK8185186.1 2-dehydro-3-deoxygalactonokinase [Sphingomonas zeae]MDK8214871.1 2-dehydro-3-deoxygalactonokinase [Sphingomonas sp. UMB7805-LC452B]NUU48598.1 2-dehydro-3-deoxygalactonokinase [Sphingomonas zeae]
MPSDVTPAYIAIDWGTTNRRCYVIAGDGTMLDTVRDDRGVLAMRVEDYPSEISAIRARFGALPVIAAGMVGSTRGWREAAYVPAPADLASLAQAATRVVEEHVTIVPGVSLLTDTRADVMRGEEVQVLGAVAAGLAPADALFAQPGTHNKWVHVEDGRITDFATTMTGELFALVKGHGILAGMLDGPVADGPAFRDGLSRGSGACDLTAALFGVRASVLLGRIAPDDAAAYASGLLIGSDIGAVPHMEGSTVHLLSSGLLADLYTIGIEARGGRVVALDSHAGFLAGLHAIREHLS